MGCAGAWKDRICWSPPAAGPRSRIWVWRAPASPIPTRASRSTRACAPPTVEPMRWALAENDRAQAEHLHRGFIKIVTNMRGRILGADIVAPSAGEMIHFWTLAVSQKLKIGAVAGMIAPYPTLAEIGKRAAGNYYLPKLFSA